MIFAAGLFVGGLIAVGMYVIARTRKHDDNIVEKSKAALEIVVIVVGAIVAAVKFNLFERPNYSRTMQFTSALTSDYQRATGACLTEFVVTVRNPSKASLSIDSVITSLAKLPQPASSGPIQEFYAFSSVPVDAVRRPWPHDSALAYKYPPEREFTDAFTWTHRPAPDSLLLARIELYHGGSMFDYRYDWAQSCSSKDTIQRD